MVHLPFVLRPDIGYQTQCLVYLYLSVLNDQAIQSVLSACYILAVQDLICLQLLRLFCPDFPLELVTDACKLCGDGDGAYPTDELLLAWRARFYYAEFLQRTAEVFETCDTRAQVLGLG